MCSIIAAIAIYDVQVRLGRCVSTQGSDFALARSPTVELDLPVAKRLRECESGHQVLLAALNISGRTANGAGSSHSTSDQALHPTGPAVFRHCNAFLTRLLPSPFAEF